MIGRINASVSAKEGKQGAVGSVSATLGRTYLKSQCVLARKRLPPKIINWPASPQLQCFENSCARIPRPEGPLFIILLSHNKKCISHNGPFVSNCLSIELTLVIYLFILFTLS